ncbi:hypothetical protein EJ994_10275 [Maribacter sp. MJ134]|uniref:glycosyl hydrolase n=1 Tax=Maribacter sp. MJ134 TaxID=2496865 RepID=UPI000F8476F8|nr:glycosyl hydrolase [Maribacter sp. MJ134]AZQ59171.1 hypothetical protein EJ994_10275 [Maribacter sp. MJ134]
MNTRPNTIVVLLLVQALLLSGNSFLLDRYNEPSPQSDVIEGFKNPPSETKARSWWHWLSGNVSKEGITADLEAMKKVGIQEESLFNVQLDFLQGPVSYLSEEC